MMLLLKSFERRSNSSVTIAGNSWIKHSYIKETNLMTTTPQPSASTLAVAAGEVAKCVKYQGIVNNNGGDFFL